jgi:hypothetical protein
MPRPVPEHMDPGTVESARRISFPVVRLSKSDRKGTKMLASLARLIQWVGEFCVSYCCYLRQNAVSQLACFDVVFREVELPDLEGYCPYISPPEIPVATGQ